MLIITEGLAVRYDDDEEITTLNEWDYSHLAENEPLPFPPKAEKAQLLLF
jgi:hypothetical protein